MDWIRCPRCGLRYLSSEPACPQCPRDRRLAPGRQRVGVMGLVSRRDGDLVSGVLHLAMAVSLAWVILAAGLPRWTVAAAALELAVSAGAVVPWSRQWILVLLRALVYGAPAVVFIVLEVGNPLLALMLLTTALAGWALHERWRVPRWVSVPSAAGSWLFLVALLHRFPGAG